MDDDRQSDLGRESQVLLEHCALNISRRVVVGEVEADLPDGDDFRMAAPFPQLRQMLFPKVGSLVGMKADGRKYRRVSLGQTDGRSTRLQIVSRRDDGRDARFDGPFDNGIQIVRKSGIIKVGVSVNQQRRPPNCSPPRSQRTPRNW